MRRTEITESKETSCNEIWELYVIMKNLDKNYLWVDTKRNVCHEEKLFYLDDVSVHQGETQYEYDPMGMELPAHKYEWVEFDLMRVENHNIIKEKYRISVDVLYENKKSVKQLMQENRMRIPGEKEISEAKYENGIPITNIQKASYI